MPFPPPSLWALGTAGVAIVMRLVVREWQRVNDELERASMVRATQPKPQDLPRLRRDPTTGVYRP
jgi:hypothetical protein